MLQHGVLGLRIVIDIGINAKQAKEDLGAGVQGVRQCAKSLSGADWHKVANKVEDGKSPFLMAIQAPKPLRC